MNQSELSTLRHQVESIEIPEVVRDSVLRLIEEHGTQQRAESFWSVRAPALNDEVVHLRQVEASARALRVALSTVIEPVGRMGDALGELDALRSKQAAA
jgi:hypothetical protein